MEYYKLTDKNNQTHNETIWGENIKHKAIGKGEIPCTADVIHVYDHPLKAVMFNPIHAAFREFNLWECEVQKAVANDGLKVGAKECTTIRQIKAPEITIAQRVRFAIYCALEVYKNEEFIDWAKDWLSGKDRSKKAAVAASGAAWAASAAEAAAGAARAASAAAGAAAWAASGAAARAASAAAEAAARAAPAAAGVAGQIDFVALIEKAIKEEKGIGENILIKG